MTYHSDPTRWTQSLGEAPELLRSGLESASREGPSELQMRALALKLAAVGTGAAVATAATAAKASTTLAGGGVAASGGALSLGKVAVSVAIAAAAATGGAALYRQSTQHAAPSVSPEQVVQIQRQAAAPQPTEPSQNVAPATPVSARTHEPAAEPKTAPVVEANAEPAVEAKAEPVVEAKAEPVVEAKAEPVVEAKAEPQLVREEPKPLQATAESTKHDNAAAGRRERRHTAAAAEPARKSGGVGALEIENVGGRAAKLSEIDLLSKARAALSARPREAYELTEQHRQLYPQGMFGQERDALAVEALQRSGDLKHARALAESFVKRYPSSPAAHRFRETMNLP